jgi:SAM-dependent methyltransferase
VADEFIYHGADLESMDLADNYHGWILDHFEPALGPRVVEVGAGIGSFSRLIALRSAPQELLMIEPSTDMAVSLAHNAGAVSVPADSFTGFLNEAEPLVREFDPTTFVYVNVFEHIEDDVAELARVFDLLQPGGTLCIFVPALPFLYSKFDRSIDHFRRYTAKELRGKTEAAGFTVDKLRYFDFPGILPWLIKFRLLGSTNLSAGSVSAYDRFVVPLIRPIENRLCPPIGKNLLLTAHKP